MAQEMVLIHGTWCNGENWGEFADELKVRGYTVHTPTARHHGSPRTSDVWANAQKVATTTLGDYVADLEDLVDKMDGPPIIVGHSLGTLIAQLLAARVPTAGLVLLGPAPSAGMWSLYPSMIRLWARYLPQWLAGKPMYPVSFKAWNKYVCNETPAEISAAYYASLCAESGVAYREMALWYLDPQRNARVDYGAIDAPALIVTGSQDKCTVPQFGRKIAKKYGARGTHVELVGSDHMMTVGAYAPETLAAIDEWATANDLAPSGAARTVRSAAPPR